LPKVGFDFRVTSQSCRTFARNVRGPQCAKANFVKGVLTISRPKPKDLRQKSARILIKVCEPARRVTAAKRPQGTDTAKAAKNVDPRFVFLDRDHENQLEVTVPYDMFQNQLSGPGVLRGGSSAGAGVTRCVTSKSNDELAAFHVSPSGADTPEQPVRSVRLH
jgi:hypothetical protein